MEFKGWEESPGHKLASGNYLEDLMKVSEKENYLFLQTPLVSPALTFLFPLVLASLESPVFLLVPPSPESLVIPPSFL